MSMPIALLVDRQEIIIVAAHFARRFAMRRDREPGQSSGPCGSSDIWMLARDAQLLLEPLLLRLLLQQVLDAARSSS